ncbi:MAG: hypothetical protein ABI432_01345 [Flavobacteriales bacterium]
MRTLFLAIPAFAMLLSGCKKDEDDPTPPVTNPPPPSFTLTLNGSQGVQMLIDGAMVGISEGDLVIPFYQEDGVINQLPELSTRFYGAGLYNSTTEANGFLMQLGTLDFEGPVVVPQDFWNFFATGTRVYGPATSGLDGLELEWTDDAGALWSTRCGSGIQSGSVFNITEVSTSVDKLGAIVRILASFNCKLYNCSTGATKVVSSGMLMLEFRDF